MYTSKDVQEKLNVSRITVMRMINQGEIPAYKVRRDWRFEEKDIEDYLERNKSR